MVSVRQTKTGRGSALRVFVNILQMLCFADVCLSKYSTIPVGDRSSPWCDHLREGVNATEEATEVKISMKTLSEKIKDKESFDLVKSHSKHGEISLYVVNKSTVLTPTFGVSLGLGLTHIKDEVCKIRDCKKVKTVHALAKVTGKICLHNLLVSVSGHMVDDESETHVVKSKINHVKSVDILLAKIEKNFPSMNDEDLKKFLPKNKHFVDCLR